MSTQVIRKCHSPCIFELVTVNDQTGAIAYRTAYRLQSNDPSIVVLTKGTHNVSAADISTLTTHSIPINISLIGNYGTQG